MNEHMRLLAAREELSELHSATVALDTPSTVRPVDEAAVTRVRGHHASTATRDVALVRNRALHEADAELGLERDHRIPTVANRHRVDARRIVSDRVHVSHNTYSKLGALAVLHKVVAQAAVKTAVFAGEVGRLLHGFRKNHARSSSAAVHSVWHKCDQHGEQQGGANMKRSTHVEKWGLGVDRVV